jgi:uncharacterized protein GlcG (DUF336 family)
MIYADPQGGLSDAWSNRWWGVEQLAYGKDLKGGTVPGLALVPGIIAFAGGLPVMTDDKVHIGGIGVSGGTADQDETCAQAGIDAVKDALK